MCKPLLILIVYLISACASTSASQFTSSYTAGINITAEVSSFVSDSRELGYCGDYLCLISGAPFWGSDGKIPHSKLSKLVVTIGAERISLDTQGMYNPVLTQDTMSERIDVNHSWGDVYRVKGVFSDGAGSYIAEWLIIKGKTLRTFIGDRESIADLASP